MKKTLFLCLLLIGSWTLCSAATITVCASGCDHTTIAGAIAAASPGDIIDIQDAVHTENNIEIDKDLTIQGQGQSTTIVQGAATLAAAVDGVFIVDGGHKVIFRDFTIRHGNARQGGSSFNTYGGGVYILSTAATDVSFERMSIKNNKAHLRGGGVEISGYFAVGAKVHFTDCVISDNEANTSARSAGGGIRNFGADDFKLIRCTISGNTAGSTGGGIHVFKPGSVSQFINCTIFNNSAGTVAHDARGGGLELAKGASFELINCTVVNNSLITSNVSRGSGIFAEPSQLILTNTIVADNAEVSETYFGDDIFLWPGGTSTITSSLVEDCDGCTSLPTFTSDPNLASAANCGEHSYFIPQGPSDALGNGAAPSGDIPIDDICGNLRIGSFDLGSYNLPPPVAQCMDITIGLDINGMANIQGSDVDNGSSAISGINALAVVPNTFDCDDFGQNTVTLTVTDNFGKTASCTASVTITSLLDNTPPTINCPTAQLRRNADLMSCEHTAIGTDLDPLPITDDCHIASITNDFNHSSSLAGAAFPVGRTWVTWTVTDGNGNTASCTYRVRIRDRTGPVFVLCPSDTTIQVPLGSTGHVFDPLLADNCTDYGDLAITGFPLPASFFPIGTTSVNWTATDDDGNSSNCVMDITVEVPGTSTPGGWTSGSVGTVSGCGTNYDASTGTLLIQTDGGNVSGTSDNFCGINFPSSDLIVDFRARVTPSGNSTADQAGIMMRQNLANNAANVAMMIGGTGSPTLQFRAVAGSFPLATTTTAVTTPYWVRLYRLGASVTGYISSDGTTWSMVGSYPFTLSNPFELVLFATSSASNGQATLDNITVNGSAPRMALEGAVAGLAVSTYPNPVRDLLNVVITTTEPGTAQLSLRNALGQQVFVERFEADGLIERRVELGEFAAGVYLLEVKTATESKTIKVQKF